MGTYRKSKGILKVLQSLRILRLPYFCSKQIIMKKLITIQATLLLFIISFARANDFEGHWKGRFTLQGSSWPMQMHISQSQNQINVLLDIPNLVYAQEPVEAVVLGTIVEITFPFGIGKRKLLRDGNKIVSTDKGQMLQFVKGEKPPYNIEPISWKSGLETLQGSIYLPASKGKKPLLVRLHGANKGTRKDWEYRSWADYFARKGIATIIFDRRGEGASTRNSNDYGLEKLADDVIALLKKIKERKDIDKIILSGASQAGYVSFIVNEKSDMIDYMLLSAASSVSIVEQERQRLLFRMRNNNERPDVINEALAYQQLYFHYIMTGKNWKVLRQASLEAQEESWGKYVDQPQKESDLTWWRASYNAYQPEKLIPKIKVPTLILFGENDLSTPPSIMVPKFEYLLKESNNHSFKMVICSGVGHSLEVQFARNRWGQIIFPQRSPEMFDAIENWLNTFILK